MSYKKSFRIILRKLLVSGFFVVAFFIAIQTEAANSITFSSLTSAYKNYVVTAPKISTPSPTKVGATPQDGNNSINKLLTSLQAQTISSLTSAYQNYLTPPPTPPQSGGAQTTSSVP